LDKVELLDLIFNENSFKANITFQVNGNCKEIKLLYEYKNINEDLKEYEISLQRNCIQTLLMKQIEIENLEYGTLTDFKIATYGFDNTSSYSNNTLIESI